jgi:hypothetical protein
MTIDLKAIRAAHAAITQPLPWTCLANGGVASTLDADGMWVADFGEAPADAEYATAAANAVPALCARVDELEAETAKLRALANRALDGWENERPSSLSGDEWPTTETIELLRVAIAREGGV